MGPSGAGKTSLARALQETGQFSAGMEEHAERPFQALFEGDRRYALANQIDYLLRRAEQERELRAQGLPALMDGGLDLDFHGFTRLFQAKGWLDEEEFKLCGRLYRLARSLLPAPDLVIAMEATPEVIRARLMRRKRINIASAADAVMLEAFINEWLASLPREAVMRVDATAEGPDYRGTVRRVLVGLGLNTAGD